MTQTDDLRSSIINGNPLEGTERIGTRHCKVGHAMTDDNTYKKRRKGGRIDVVCRTCTLERSNKWRRDNPERWAELVKRHNSKKQWTPDRAESHRWWRLERKYGITKEQFHELWEKQAGMCAICSMQMRMYAPRSEKGVRPELDTAAVDHCHTTGRVRGLLCLGCNLAVGGFRDSPERCLRAAAYLKEHGK